MRRFIFFVFILLVQIQLQAQAVQITRILDSNRFFTSDSQTISLANVAIPSKTTKDSLQALIARRALIFAQNNLKGYHFTYTVARSGSTRPYSAALPVYLFKEFPLEKQFVNELYVERGLGKYVPPADSVYAQRLEKAGIKAKQKGTGLWNPLAIQTSRTAQLVSVFYGAGVNTAYSTEFRSYGLHFETRSKNSSIGLTFGYRKSAESGTGCCECAFIEDYDGYTEYLTYFKRGYLSLSYQYFWKYLSAGWGGTLTTAGGGFCSETGYFPHIVNSFIIESMPIYHYILTVSYRDEFVFDYGKRGYETPVFFGIGRRSGFRFASFIWAGLSWSDNHIGAAFKYDQRLLKKWFLQARGGLMPNKGNVFIRLYIGYLFE